MADLERGGRGVKPGEEQALFVPRRKTERRFYLLSATYVRPGIGSTPLSSQQKPALRFRPSMRISATAAFLGPFSAATAFTANTMSPQGVNRALSMLPSPFADPGAATDDAANSPAKNDDEASPFKISLWLLPPEDVRTHLQSNIDEIAALTGGPSFVPHATILGGIPCLCSTEEEAEQWAHKLLTTLRTQLPAVGGIPYQFGLDQGCRPQCVFEDGKILNGNDVDENNAADGDSSSCDVKWNQSAVSIMNRSVQFAKAVQLTYRAVCKTDESLGGGTVPLPSDEEISSFDWTTTLKPPLCQPHYSIAYGNHPDLIFVKRNINANAGGGYLAEVPPDFVSTEAMLIWTWPASLEGVPTWREVGRIRLC